METIRIKSVYGGVLFEHTEKKNTQLKTVRAALNEKVPLRKANFREWDLPYLDARKAEFIECNFQGANLHRVNFENACLNLSNFNKAQMYGANLNHAYMYDCFLYCADIRNASLIETDLRGCDLRGVSILGHELDNVIYDSYTTNLHLQCPEEGSFIGWKAASGYIVKLLITEDAKRSSGISMKCRCSKAKVLDIQNLDGSFAGIDQVMSNFDPDFIYKIGEIVEVEDFDKNRWNECSTGIHFYLFRKMAMQWITGLVR